ncbi:MAG: GNAT family N-acetyltransferase [Eubacteriaceae bacterium]|nr:GNAT family N-acetyltransferase [Eubacteriaceae bacterium]
MLSELPMPINNPLQGKIINLRLVSTEDAEFILSLRKNPLLNQHISSTEISVEEQKNWLRAYKSREELGQEVYFIVENKAHHPVGTVRIYKIDPGKNECTWGSFILNENRPENSSAEVISLSAGFVFDELKLQKIKLDVRRENSKAIHIYEKYGFKRVAEDDLDYYYEMKRESQC